MFEAYFDESGTHHGSPVLSLAGYVASVEQWGEFVREWRGLLDEVPDRKLIHMTDLECGHGIWKNHPKHARQAVVKKALGIIKRRVQYGFSNSVDVAAFDGLITQPLRRLGFTAQDGAHSAYSFCLAGCLKQVAHWADTYGYKEPIAYFFESGAGFGRDVTQMMSSLDHKMKSRYRLRQWSFASKADVLPLQAADVIAYESYKYWVNELHSSKRRPIRRSFETLLETPHDGQYLDRGALNRFLARLQKDPDQAV